MQRAKDSSRLGRNHIEVENYLQMVFPMLKVRVICVNEGYDSKKSITNEAISFQNLINDFYSRDISMKIRSGHQQKWKKGELITGRAPYGYMCKDIKKGFEIDTDAAEVVKRIFTEAAEGKTTGQIAEGLNSDVVPDPYSYLLKRDKNKSRFDEKMDASRVWSTGTIRKILKTEAYTGVRIAHARTKRRNGRQVRVPEEEQFRYEDDHEAVVSRELFEKGRMAIRSRRDNNGKQTQHRGGLFQGILRCGNCNMKMKFSGLSYRCGGGRMSEFTGCSVSRFSEDELRVQVWSILLEKSAKARRILDGQEEIPVADGIEEEIQIWKKKQMDSFVEMSAGKITQEEFIVVRDEVREKVTELENRRSDIAGKNGYRIDLEYALKPLARVEEGELTMELLESLVESIYVLEDHIDVETKAEQYLQR